MTATLSYAYRIDGRPPAGHAEVIAGDAGYVIAELGTLGWPVRTAFRLEASRTNVEAALLAAGWAMPVMPFGNWRRTCRPQSLTTAAHSAPA